MKGISTMRATDTLAISLPAAMAEQIEEDSKEGKPHQVRTRA
jgi:hypothetical protein